MLALTFLAPPLRQPASMRPRGLARGVGGAEAWAGSAQCTAHHQSRAALPAPPLSDNAESFPSPHNAASVEQWAPCDLPGRRAQSELPLAPEGAGRKLDEEWRRHERRDGDVRRRDGDVREAAVLDVRGRRLRSAMVT